MKRAASPSSHAHIPAKLKYKRRKIEEFQQQQQMLQAATVKPNHEEVQIMAPANEGASSDAASSNNDVAPSNGTSSRSQAHRAPHLSIPKPAAPLRQPLQISPLSNDEAFLGNYNGYAYFCLDPTGSHISLPTNVLIDALIVSMEQLPVVAPQNLHPQPAPSLYFLLSRFESYYYFLITNHDVILSTYRFHLEKQEMQQLNIIAQMTQDEQEQMDILKFLHLISSHGMVRVDRDPMSPAPPLSASTQTQDSLRSGFQTPSSRLPSSLEQDRFTQDYEPLTPSSAMSTITLNRRRCFLSQLCHQTTPPQIDQLTPSEISLLLSDIQHLFSIPSEAASVVQQFIVNSYTQFHQERIFAAQLKDSPVLKQRPQKPAPQSTAPFIDANIFSSLEDMSLSQKHALTLQYAQHILHTTQKPIFSMRCLNQAYSDIVLRYKAALNDPDADTASDIAWQQIQNVLTCQIHYCQQLRASGDLFNSLLVLYYLTLFFAYGHAWLSERDLQREKQLSQSVREFVAGYTFSIIPNVSPGLRTWWTLAMQELGAIPNSLIETRTASAAISHGWDNSVLQRVMNGKRAFFEKWKSMEPASCGLMRIDMLIHQKEFKKAYFIASAIGETPKWLHLMANKQRTHSATTIILQCEKNSRMLTDLAQMLRPQAQNFAQSMFVACRALQRAWKEYQDLLPKAHNDGVGDESTESVEPEGKGKARTAGKKKRSSGSGSKSKKKTSPKKAAKSTPPKPSTPLSSPQIESASQFLRQVALWLFENYLKPLPAQSRSVLTSPLCSPVAHYLYPERFDISDKELRPKLSDMYDKFRNQQESLHPLVVGFMLKYVPTPELIQIAIGCFACGKKWDAFDILLWVYHTQGSLFSEKNTDRLLNLASEFNKLSSLLQPTNVAIQADLYPTHEYRSPDIYHIPTEAPIPFKWTKILYRTDIHLAHGLGMHALAHSNARLQDDLDLPWFCQSVCLSLSRQHVLDVLGQVESLQVKLHPQVLTQTANYIEETMGVEQSFHFLANCLSGYIKLLHGNYAQLSSELRYDNFFSELLFQLMKSAGRVSFDNLVQVVNTILPGMLFVRLSADTLQTAYDHAVLRIMEHYMHEKESLYALILAQNWTMRQSQELAVILQTKQFEPSHTKLAICRLIFELYNVEIQAAQYGANAAELDVHAVKFSTYHAALVIFARECPLQSSVEKVVELWKKQILPEKDFKEILLYIAQRPLWSADIRRDVVHVLLGQGMLKEAVEYESKLQLSMDDDNLGFCAYDGALVCHLIEQTFVGSDSGDSDGSKTLSAEDYAPYLWRRLLSVVSQIPWISVSAGSGLPPASIDFGSLDRVLGALAENETYSVAAGFGTVSEFSTYIASVRELLQRLKSLRAVPVPECNGDESARQLAQQINELRTLYEKCFKTVPHGTGSSAEHEMPQIVNQFASRLTAWVQTHEVMDKLPVLAEALKAAGLQQNARNT